MTVFLKRFYIRHGLVDGLHSVAHGKLINNLLWSLLKVNFPCVIPFSIGNFNYAIVLDVRHIVKEVLHQGNITELRVKLKRMYVREEKFELTYECISFYTKMFSLTTLSL